MRPASAAAETLVSPTKDGQATITLVVAASCLIWYAVVALVCSIGYVQLWRHFSAPRPRAKLEPEKAPHITIIRPVKGLEPRLYDCLASTFRQDYPKDKLHARFCISDRNDPSLPVVQQLLRDFSDYDAQLLIEEEDVLLQNGQVELGPNPKIRNMSRAYREAPGDIIWIIDCNVWVAKGVCGRMVCKLEGHGEKYRYKFAHHLPLVVDTVESTTVKEAGVVKNSDLNADVNIRTTNSGSATLQRHSDRTALSIGGGRLEEVFMASSHSKFYAAFQTVLIAPCIVGKSTMFRSSHLNSLTNGRGIDSFSKNICEDHLIGDLLWKEQVAEEVQEEKIGKHALCWGDIAVQPMANMSVSEYWSRRSRWLRVRKFTVILATLVEPGIESYLCSLYGAFAITTLPFFHNVLGIPQTWRAFALIWPLSVSIWCFMDWTLYLKLHSAASIEIDQDTPLFAQPPENSSRRPFGEWLLAWLGRETLAFPIWVCAVYGGTTMEWRGKKFRVGMDTKVHEITSSPGKGHLANGHIGLHAKVRRD